MTTLLKKQIALKASRGRPGWYQVKADDGTEAFVLLGEADYEDMHAPRKITVTIEPGDTLND